MEIHLLLSKNTTSPLEQIHRYASRSNPELGYVAPQAERSTYRPEMTAELTLSASAIPASVDPHVAGFLKSVLGSRKWKVFSSKLCERKDSGITMNSRNNVAREPECQKGKSKQFSSAYFPDDEDGVLHGGTSPCAIAFLVKVEIVKEVLRNYVPNPYHPLKAESHPYPPAPGGIVHVTRASVLALCQWSNTQFAYWSRRSEAVSVLACHDSGLRDLFYVLYQRLYQRDPPAHAFAISSPAASASWSSTASSSGSPPPYPTPAYSTSRLPASDVVENERRLRVARSFTGKGLDGMIADIKKRTGASQFLRGRQSSLDPFGAHLETGAAAYDPNWPVIMPSEHGKHMHMHSRTTSTDSYDFNRSSTSLLGDFTQPSSVHSSPSGPSRFSELKNGRRRHTFQSSLSSQDFDFIRTPPRTPSWSSYDSGSPHSGSSTTGGKRKREDAFCDEQGLFDEAECERGQRRSGVERYNSHRPGAKRTKTEL